VPSLEDVMLRKFPKFPKGLLRSVQVAPESIEVQAFPPSTTAASLVPSLEEAMPHQRFALPSGLRSVQVAPESIEVQMFPSWTLAARFVPSLEEAMPRQSFVLPPRLRSVQVFAADGVSPSDFHALGGPSVDEVPSTRA
jgi:hypothetical protein